MNRCFVLTVAVVLIAPLSFAQGTKFRSGVFLHHSTGNNIWGPNGSNTSVPEEIVKYNLVKVLSGSDTVSLSENGWPVTPWDNEWERWHRIFEDQDTVNADIRPILAANKILVIKSCFPSSDLSGAGIASDTTNNPTSKTIYNYKWHWRSFLSVMRQHPDNFFIVWTNAPLVAGSTNDNAAHFSDQFCRWAKDTLAQGLDPLFGAFPKNVYVFDFFHKLAGSDGKLPAQYAASSTDSHPNSAATALVAPQFVQEVFNYSIAYEMVSSVGLAPGGIPGGFHLSQNYPNPFNPTTEIRYQVSVVSDVRIVVYDILAREVAVLENEKKAPGSYAVQFNASGLASGVYLYRLHAGNFVETKKLILLK